MKEVHESTGKPLIDPYAKGIGSEQISDPEKKLVKTDILRLSRDAVMQTRFREKNCFQFDITIEYDKEKKEIRAKPKAEDWINAIPQHFEAALQQLTNVKCFLSDKLGAIHPEAGHVVFQTDPEYPE